MTRSFTLAMLLVASFSVQAEIYRWTDEGGQVHYSDLKSTQHISEHVEVKSQLVGTVKLSSTIKEAAANRVNQKAQTSESSNNKSSSPEKR